MECAGNRTCVQNMGGKLSRDIARAGTTTRVALDTRRRLSVPGEANSRCLYSLGQKRKYERQRY